MIDVFVTGKCEEVGVVCALGNQLQDHFRFDEAPDSAVVTVEFSETMDTGLFAASREGIVKVSTWQSDEISRYSEKPRELYLLTGALLGLAEWRALALNPLLMPEDFLVREERPACLYALRETVQEYALAFEHPYICKACLEFFRCLGAEAETVALLQVLAHMSHQDRYSTSF